MPCGPFNLGQGAQTADCGYFCGYMLMLNNQPGGYRPGGLTREQTLEAIREERDSFRSERGLGTALQFLSIENMVGFLSFLGLSGYGHYPNRTQVRYERAQLPYKQRVQHDANCGAGLILLLQRAGASAGHYIAVLRSEGPNLCCYDPMRPQRSGLINADAFAREFWNCTEFFISHA